MHAVYHTSARAFKFYEHVSKETKLWLGQDLATQVEGQGVSLYSTGMPHFSDILKGPDHLHDS